MSVELLTPTVRSGPRARLAAGRLRAGVREPLTRNALTLMASTAGSSLLGLAFWAIASRRFSPAQIGEDAALISVLILLSSVSELNLGASIPYLLPRSPDRRRFVRRAYGAAAGMSAAVSGAFVLLAPHLLGGFAFLGHDPALSAGVVFAVTLWTLFALQDAVLAALQRAVLVPLDNGVFGVVKIGLVVLLAHRAHGIFIAWGLSAAILVVPVTWALFGPFLRQPAAGRTGNGVPTGAQPRPTGAYLAADYLAALFNQASTMLLPLIVLAVLGRAANGYFYLPFTVALALDGLANALCTSLVVEAAHDPSAVAHLARQAFRRWAGLLVPALAVVVAVAPLILRPFGLAYAQHGATVLRLLAAGAAPQALILLHVALLRIRGAGSRILAVHSAAAVGVVGGSILLAGRGLTGVGLAWLIANTAVAVAVLPALRATMTLPSEAGAGQ